MGDKAMGNSANIEKSVIRLLKAEKKLQYIRKLSGGVIKNYLEGIYIKKIKHLRIMTLAYIRGIR